MLQMNILIFIDICTGVLNTLIGYGRFLRSSPFTPSEVSLKR